MKLGRSGLIAERDPLTGVLNGRNLIDRIQAAIEEARAGLCPLSLARVDPDGLREINRKHGVPTGDLVLIGLAEIARQRCRPTDLIVRFGHGDFFVVMPNTDAQSALAMLDGIRGAFAATLFCGDDGRKFIATLSAGIAQLQPELMESEELWRQVYHAKCEAKQSGGNCVRVAGERAS